MQVQHEDLKVGMVVWYQFSNTKSVQGPYLIKNIFGRYDGKSVDLANDHESVTLQLADDDIFGLLLFYDTNPSPSE